MPFVSATPKQKRPFNKFGIISVSPDVETDILLFNDNKRVSIQGLVLSTELAGRWRLYINGNLSANIMHSAGELTKEVQFGDGTIEVEPNQEIKVTALHNTNTDITMSCNIFGLAGD